MLSNLITDRTAADAQRVKELARLGWENMTEEQQAEWLAGMRGAYNAEDLNRVNDAARHLAQNAFSLIDILDTYRAAQGVAPDAAFLLPYKAEDVVIDIPASLWTVEDIPVETDMETYLKNVVTMRDLLEVAVGTPALPSSMSNLTVDGANAIEESLLATDDAQQAMEALTKEMIDKTAAAWYFSGEIYTGEVN